MASLFLAQKEINFNELITRCKKLNLIFGNTKLKIIYVNKNLNTKNLSTIKSIFKKYLNNVELEIDI